MRPLDIIGSTDPTNDDGDYWIIRMNDPANIEILRLGLDQEFGALDTMAQGHLRVMHRI
jgi:hypothetical protein